MKKLEARVVLNFHDSESDIAPEYKNLIIKSREASKSSYSPYSHFPVGCALLLEDGSVITGSNQENASYPEGLCAERVALFYAGAQFPDKKILAAAIAAPVYNQPGYPLSPCGGCRQVMYEYEWKQDRVIKIFLTGMDGGIWECDSARSLLPFPFKL
jgi:cytidine deaminase